MKPQNIDLYSYFYQYVAIPFFVVKKLDANNFYFFLFFFTALLGAPHVIYNINL